MKIQTAFNYSKITCVILITLYLDVDIHFTTSYASNVTIKTNSTQKCV